MVSKQKQKGTRFENWVADQLNDKLINGVFKRIIMSGALGNIAGEPSFMGDVKGIIEGFPKKLKAECKAGYSNKKDSEAKSLTLQKEWLDKIAKEAEQDMAMPIFFGRFDNARSGVKAFVAFDLDTFIELANHITKLHRERDRLYDKLNSK